MNKKPTCFSTKISLSLKDKLQKDLEEKGFQISQPAYTVFSAVKKGISCTLYQSGSLTVQGKEKDDFIEFYLEPEILGNFSYSYPLQDIDLTPRIGADEAGKGDFFGPIVTASLYANTEQIKQLVELGVKDSKTFSDTKVCGLAKKIREICSYEVFCLMPCKYNPLYKKFQNLNRMLAWLHTTCIKKLVEKSGCKQVILDQFAKEYLMQQFIEKANLAISLEQKVRAEQDVVVAAASIIARDCFLSSLDSLSQPFGLQLPKGAAKAVVETAKIIIKKFGVNTLDNVSKNHFKTRLIATEQML